MGHSETIDEPGVHPGGAGCSWWRQTHQSETDGFTMVWCSISENLYNCRWLELNRCVNAQIGLRPYLRISECSGSTWNGNGPACWEVTSRVSIPSQKQSAIRKYSYCRCPTVYSLYSYCSAEFRLTLSDITGVYTILGAVIITRSLPHCNRIHM